MNGFLVLLFNPHRDKDNDGKLNLEEFKKWLIPDHYDPTNVEAVHLIQHADSDMVYIYCLLFNNMD